MMSTFRQMTEKNGPTPHSPFFPNSDRVSTSSSREHLHTNMQSHPNIYKPFWPTMPQFLDSPYAVPLAQAEPEESMSAYLREYRALGEDFHSAMTFTNFFHFKIKNKTKAYNIPFTQNYELQRTVGSWLSLPLRAPGVDQPRIGCRSWIHTSSSTPWLRRIPLNWLPCIWLEKHMSGGTKG